MNHRKNFLTLLVVTVMVLPLAACSPKIYGTVQLLDTNMLPITNESPLGTVVNMINTTASLEDASYSAIADEEGKFESQEKTIKPGIYKVEAKRIGYATDTQTLKIGSGSSKEVNLKLKRIQEEKRKSIEGARSDEDKIINPGEVNIQPPLM